MKKIGLISDTHGTFDTPLRQFLEEVDEVWHAGDFGSLELADQIASFKPLRGVYGNIDGGVIRRVYPRWQSFVCEGVEVLMTHIGGYPGHYAPGVIERLMSKHPRLFISGHAHILKVIYDPKYELLHINPGAAGLNGFHAVRTAVRFTLQEGRIEDLEVGEWPRRY